MLSFARTYGSWRWARGLARAVFVRRRPSLRQTLHGIPFAAPVGVAAGFDKNGDTVPVIASLGFGFMTVGSVTAATCEGNPRPWFYRLPKTKSLVVHVGLANQGSAPIIERLEGYGAAVAQSFPVVLSVAKTNSPQTVSDSDAIADYVTSVRRANESPAISMIEINISCPNTYGGEPFTTPDRLEQLLAAIDAVNAKQPIIIKMPLSLPWAEFDALLKVIVRHNVAGVTIANLLKSRENIKDELPEGVPGGLSGKPTQTIGNELIRKTYQRYGNQLTIIGVGGIFSAEDAYEKIRLGASVVELITGMIFQGPQIAAEINARLPKLLEKDGFVTISDAIGVDAGAS